LNGQSCRIRRHRMGNFLFFIWILLFGYFTWHVTNYIRSNIDYKLARTKEIKRRLQVEHKQEQVLNERLKQPMDDNERLKVITKFGHERHQRAIHYVIEDMFERYQ
jgi:hypothetical protein